MIKEKTIFKMEGVENKMRTVEVRSNIAGDIVKIRKGVVFKDGCECSCTDVEDEITGEWELNADGISFMLHVASKEESNE